MKIFDKIFNKKPVQQLPTRWHADGIYLQDAEKQVKAVCSNDKIAYFIAECVNEHFAKTAENASIAAINAEKAATAAKEAVEMAKRAKMEAELATRTIDVISIAPPRYVPEPEQTPQSVSLPVADRSVGPNTVVEPRDVTPVQPLDYPKAVRIGKFKDFIEDTYYLYVAISKAQIPVTTIGLAFMEKAFHKFCRSMTAFFKAENIRIHDSDGNELRLDLPEEVNNTVEKEKDL